MKPYLSSHIDINSKDIISILDETPLWSAPFGLKLLENVKLIRNAKVLDIGSGMGFPLIELAQRFGSSSKIYGIDPWIQGHDRIKEKIRLIGLNNIEIIEGVAEELPFDDNFFDIITSNNGINNVQDTNKTLSECYRTLKQGGQFIFTFNLETTFRLFYDIFELTLLKFQLEDLVPNLKEHIYEKRKPLDEIRKVVEDAGFRINDILIDIFSYRFIDGTSFLNYFLIRLGFHSAWTEFLPQNMIETIFNSIESELNNNAKQKGEVRMDVPFALFDLIK